VSLVARIRESADGLYRQAKAKYADSDGMQRAGKQAGQAARQASKQASKQAGQVTDRVKDLAAKTSTAVRDARAKAATRR
jgi:hypothetical protein